MTRKEEIEMELFLLDMKDHLTQEDFQYRRELQEELWSLDD